MQGKENHIVVLGVYSMFHVPVDEDLAVTYVCVCVCVCVRVCLTEDQASQRQQHKDNSSLNHLAYGTCKYDVIIPFVVCVLMMFACHLSNRYLSAPSKTCRLSHCHHKSLMHKQLVVFVQIARHTSSCTSTDTGRVLYHIQPRTVTRTQLWRLCDDRNWQWQ